MRNRFVKLASIVTMLALTLTGCSLIAVDPVMQADEDMAALQKEYSVPVATYDGGEITMFDVVADYNNQFSYLYYIYSMYGYTVDHEMAHGILDSVLEAHMNTRASLLKAEEMGIVLTDEERGEAEEAAQAAYQESYDSAYASAEGDTEELKRKNTLYALYERGETPEMHAQQQVWTRIVDKVEAAVKAEVGEIAGADLEAAYDARVIEDQAAYENNLSGFETDMNDPEKLITWMPEGYRTVKHILVKVDEDALAPVTAANSALNAANSQLSALEEELGAASGAPADEAGEAAPRAASDIQADIDAKQAEIANLEADLAEKRAACLATVQEKLDEIYEKLAAGESFDSVMAEYGEDPGMQSEPAMTRGYVVSAASTVWDTNFRDAAMALEGVGDYALEPAIGASGVHIIYYYADVTPGAVPLETIRDAFAASALAEAQDAHMQEQLAKWVAALNPVYMGDKFFGE
jgi:hypothetical protein